MTAIFQLPRAFPVVGDTVLASGITVPRALPGAKLEFYVANTATPQDVFTNSSKSIKHTWPVVADATGKFPVIYLPSGITLDAILKTSGGAAVDTYEDIPGDTVEDGSSTSSVGRTMEVGAIVWHSLQEVPLGWLRIKKDPQPLNKSEYPELNDKYSVQGYPYGSTSTTFNIPGGAGLFPRIWDDTSTWDVDEAARKDHATGTTTTVGNLIGSRQISQNITHSHGPGSLATNATGNHNHNWGDSNPLNAAAGGSGSAQGGNTDFTTSTDGNHSHTVNSGTTAASGGTEARPANIAFPLIILVNPALAASTHSTLGVPYSFSSSVDDTDPGAGYLRFDDASVSIATHIYISKTSAFGVDLSTLLASIDLIGGTARAVITITNVAAMANTATVIVTSALVDGGNYYKIPVTVKSFGGSFLNDAKLAFQLSLSGQGTVGPSGPNSGLDYKWNTAITDTDPANGFLKVNNATLGSATFVYISKTGRNAEALGTVIQHWGDSTQASNKGALRIFATADRTKYIEAIITGPLVDGTAYWKLPVTVYGSGSAFAADDILCVMFSRAGDGVALTVIQMFVASGTYTKTSGARMAHVRGSGGGASGGGVSGVAANAAGASGGSAGAEFDFWLDLAAITTETVTIGAGGAAPTAGANNGNNGGATSFGAHATANGGVGGAAMAAGTVVGVVAPSAGGTPTGLGGKKGNPSLGGIRLSGTVALSGNGGSSRYGSGGAGLVAAAGGNAGSEYGAGGSGGLSTAGTAQTGGAGAPGIIIVEEYF